MQGMIRATLTAALLVALATRSQTSMGIAFPSIAPLSKSDCSAMEQHHTLRPDNPVVCQRLRAIRFRYHSDNGIKSDGTLVVLDVVAPDVAMLMYKLFEQGFYINKARPLEEYDGDDLAAMNDNNTSAFNGRQTATRSHWSLHAYGVAIDLNPLQNPAIYPNQQEEAGGHIVLGPPGTALIRPSAAASGNNNYLNRNVYRARPDTNGFYRPGMAETAADLFAHYGFLNWGGYWNDPLDYQHFEVGPLSFIERLYAADPSDSTDPVNGRKLFARYVRSFRGCLALNHVSDAARRRAFCANQTIITFSKAT